MEDPYRNLHSVALCRRFDDTITFDRDTDAPRVERSAPSAELRRRGSDALSAIVSHISALPVSTDSDDLRRAWVCLLSLMEAEVDSTLSAPKDLTDVSGWVAWAKRFAAK